MIPSGTATQIAVNNSPIVSQTVQEIIRIARPGSTVTITGATVDAARAFIAGLRAAGTEFTIVREGTTTLQASGLTYEGYVLQVIIR